jgi:hypothetical protein
MRKEIETVFVVVDWGKAKVAGVFSSRPAATRFKDAAKKPDELEIVPRNVRKR